jgi:hypothetical protein
MKFLSAGAGSENTGARKVGRAKGGRGVDSLGAGAVVVLVVSAGRRVSKWVMSAASAGPRSSSVGSYMPCSTGLLECVDKASSKALNNQLLAS